MFKSQKLKISLEKKDKILHWLQSPIPKKTAATDYSKCEPMFDKQIDSQPMDKSAIKALFDSRIASQKKLMKEHHIPNEFIDIEGIRTELHMESESKLKRKCHNLRISAEGNKTQCIERIVDTLYANVA